MEFPEPSGSTGNSFAMISDKSEKLGKSASDVHHTDFTNFKFSSWANWKTY